MKYLIFTEKRRTSKAGMKRFSWQNLLWKAISVIVPNANPDFDLSYDFVETWYIEYDESCEKDGTVREIGIDCYERIIVKAPDARNYGFWNDTNMGISDFIKQKHAKYITQEEFESVWNEKLVKVSRKDYP